MSKKENLDLDEIGTYGLANNSYQLHVSDWKDYSGIELLLDYASVKKGHEFDIVNLFSNQARDTHPPIHYMILNFICSIRQGTFSIWYGLIINLLFMLIIFWGMRHLLILIMNDELSSTLLAIGSFLTYGFVNEFVFIRMYTMLTAISLMFIILIIDKMNSSSKSIKTDVVFLIKFIITCIIGVLTQYQFIFIAIYFSVVFGIYLIIKKDIKMFVSTLFAGILSIALSIVIFPSMINHIFGKNAIHSINVEDINARITEKLTKYLSTIQQSFFGKGIFIYVLLFLVGILLYFILKSCKKEKIKEILVNNRFYFIILLCSIFSFIAVLVTTRYAYARYLYNIYPLIIISLYVPIYLLFKNIKPLLKFISVALIILMAFMSQYKMPPSSLNIGDNSFYDFLEKHKDVKVLSLYRTTGDPRIYTSQSISYWKMHRPLYIFRNLESISYIDLSKYESTLYQPISYLDKLDTLFLVIYPEEDDNKIISKFIESNKFATVEVIYISNYFHMYLLSR